MKDIHGNTLDRKDWLQQPGMAHLFKLYLRNTTTIYKYTNWDTHLTFAGDSYAPAPITISSISQDREGSAPEVQVSLSNVDRIIIPVMERYNAFRGARVEVRTVFVDDLDNCVLDVFWVNSAQANESTVTFSLTSRLNVFDIKIPQQFYFRDYCSWIYKGTECGYVPYSWGKCSVNNGSNIVYTDRIHNAFWYYGGIWKVADDDIFKVNTGTRAAPVYGSEYTVTNVSLNILTHRVIVTLNINYTGNSNNLALYAIDKPTCPNTYRACLEHGNMLRFGGFPGMVSKKVRYM